MYWTRNRDGILILQRGASVLGAIFLCGDGFLPRPHKVVYIDHSQPIYQHKVLAMASSTNKAKQALLAHINGLGPKEP